MMYSDVDSDVIYWWHVVEFIFFFFNVPCVTLTFAFWFGRTRRPGAVLCLGEQEGGLNTRQPGRGVGFIPSWAAGGARETYLIRP